MSEFLNSQPELQAGEESVKPPKIVEQAENNKSSNISRRKFLKMLGTSAVGLAIGSKLDAKEPEQIPPLVKNKPVELPTRAQELNREQETSNEFDPLRSPGSIVGITELSGHEYLTITDLKTKKVVSYQLDNILWDEGNLYSKEAIAKSLKDLQIQIRESDIVITIPRIKDKDQNKRFYFDIKKEIFLKPKGSGIEDAPQKPQVREILSGENQKYKTELSKRGWLPIYDYGYDTNKVLVVDDRGESRYFRIVDLKTMQDTPVSLQKNNSIFRGPIVWGTSGLNEQK